MYKNDQIFTLDMSITISMERGEKGWRGEGGANKWSVADWDEKERRGERRWWGRVVSSRGKGGGEGRERGTDGGLGVGWVGSKAEGERKGW